MITGRNNKRLVLFILAILTLLALTLFGYVYMADAQVGYERDGCLFISEIGWAGTEASTADEWYEIGNTCSVDVDTNGWFLQTVRLSDGRVTTSTMPVITVGPGQVALMERTDDNTISNVQAAGIHGSGGTGGSLVGVFPNNDVALFMISNEDTSEYHIINMTGNWPAGSSTPKASMQMRFDAGGHIEWYTSNQSVGALDADGNNVLGTPGQVNIDNSPNPATCSTVVPVDYNWEFRIRTYEDESFQPYILLTATLWGIDSDGNLIQTDGQAEVVWIDPPGVGMGSGWVAGELYAEPGTSDECVDAMQMLKDTTETYMRSGTTGDVQLQSLFLGYMDTIKSFQRSGLFNTNLPIVMNGE